MFVARQRALRCGAENERLFDKLADGAAAAVVLVQMDGSLDYSDWQLNHLFVCQPYMPSPNNSRHHEKLISIAQQSSWFMQALRAVRSLKLQSWCIGAGAVRNLVWDYLHDYNVPSVLADLDVAYFDITAELCQDIELQESLNLMEPSIPWEVTNQAFVHTWFERYFGYHVQPLHSLEEAVATWPEFATSVGITLSDHDRIDIIAPHGLEDLFAMRIQRNPTRASIETYRSRVLQKEYPRRWPRVTVVP